MSSRLTQPDSSGPKAKKLKVGVSKNKPARKKQKGDGLLSPAIASQEVFNISGQRV